MMLLTFYILPTAIFIAIGMAIYISNIERVVKKFASADRNDLPFRYKFGWSFAFMWLSLIFCLITSTVCVVISCRERKPTKRETTELEELEAVDRKANVI